MDYSGEKCAHSEGSRANSIVDGKDRFVPQTMTYLLLKSIHENAKAIDVKRIYNLRHGLRLLDFQDERFVNVARFRAFLQLSNCSAVTMKRLLLSCTINPLFLRTADGIKFIAYLFSIYHPFVDELHMAIKAQVLKLVICCITYAIPRSLRAASRSSTRTAKSTSRRGRALQAHS